MKRIKEFLKVIYREKGELSSVAVFFILANAIWKVLPYWLLAKEIDRLEWKRRYKVCLRCPIFDAELKRCKPFDNSTRGCGCYTPFSNLVYEECWGRLNYGKAIGWSGYDPESWLERVRYGQGNKTRRGSVEKRDWTI